MVDDTDVPNDPGWRIIGPDPRIANWAHAALPRARTALAQTDQPLRCGGTWAVGLDLLDNDAAGTVAGCDLPWAALGLAPQPLHQAQVSGIYPGYPQPWPGESAAAMQYRISRDAAHLDGLLPIGPDRRRMIKEPHAWILGLALTDCAAAPLVVWDGSHRVMQSALRRALAAHPPQDWGNIDITDVYQAARAQVFATCPRVEVPIVRGQATLLHRAVLHGVAPWPTGFDAGQTDRIIAYFRPMLASVQDWLLRD